MKIFICGDSTAAEYEAEKTLMVGWGQALGDLMPGTEIVNLAMAGRSTKTFLEEGRLEPAASGGRSGDLMLIQFAHNDENEKKPERYVPIPAFRENLGVFIRFAREQGMRPIVLTPICMRIWQDGTLQPTHGEYPAAARAAAEAEGVPVIDVYSESFRIVKEMGEEGSRALFMDTAGGGEADNAHTRRAGAERFAEIVAKGLKALGY